MKLNRIAKEISNGLKSPTGQDKIADTVEAFKSKSCQPQTQEQDQTKTKQGDLQRNSYVANYTFNTQNLCPAHVLAKLLLTGQTVVYSISVHMLAQLKHPW